MSFFDTIGVLGRHWRVVVPAALLALAAAVLVGFNVGAEYQATGTLLMVAPNPPVGTAARGNPYLAFNGSLNVSADVVVRIMTKDDATVRRMEAAGATAKYDLGTGSVGPTPIITVVTHGKTPEEALQTVATLSQGIAAELDRLQKATGAPQDTWIRAEVLTAPEQATLMLGSPIRAFLATLALGAAAIVILAFAAEGLAQRGWVWRSEPSERRLPA